MAQTIVLTSGSIFNGNPITVAVTPSIIYGPTMHRLVLCVVCGLSRTNLETIRLSSPVPAEDGTPITFDISSALRTFRDTYTYIYGAAEYPTVLFRLYAYDEYITDGEIRKTEEVYLPSQDDPYAYYHTLFGGFTDMERLTAGSAFKGVTRLSRKPTTTPQLVVKGETFAYTPPFATEQMLEQSLSLTPPQSKIVTVSKEGAQTLGYQSVYALPTTASKDRQLFRFINGYGVLESISVPRVGSKKLSVTSEQYNITRQETFNTFSRMAVRKHDNRESWQFQTDPLDEAWLSWYLHEFLMSEHVWLYLPSLITGGAGGGSWLRVHITPDEDLTFLDRTNTEHHRVTFTAQLDINGSPI